MLKTVSGARRARLHSGSVMRLALESLIGALTFERPLLGESGGEKLAEVAAEPLLVSRLARAALAGSIVA
jgi:hypothetical protein